MCIDTLQLTALRLVSAVLVFFLGACGGPVNKPFNPVDEHKSFKVSSIAVISGSDHDGDVQLARMLTKGIAERSSFRVLPQEEIEKRVPNYPWMISLRNDIKPDDEKPVWFSADQRAKLNSIQAKLKVDYLFVIWNSHTTLVTTQGSSTYYVHPIGNLIEYPSGTVVAATRTSDSSFISPLALFRPNDYYIVDALRSAAKNIVGEFVHVTKSRKP
jgi:hypothetical protein